MQLLLAETALDSIVRAEGNLALAAERLKVQPADLLGALAEDQTCLQSLNYRLRVATTLAAFQTLSDVRIVLQASLADLPPQHLPRLYSDLLGHLDRLTDPHSTTQTQNINIVEVALRMLPPAARQALLELSVADTDTNSDPG